jgi:hypothetical protein
MIETRRMRWAVYVACMGNTRNSYKNAVEKSGKGRASGISSAQYWNESWKTGLSWFRIRSGVFGKRK